MNFREKKIQEQSLQASANLIEKTIGAELAEIRHLLEKNASESKIKTVPTPEAILKNLGNRKATLNAIQKIAVLASIALPMWLLGLILSANFVAWLPGEEHVELYTTIAIGVITGLFTAFGSFIEALKAYWATNDIGTTVIYGLAISFVTVLFLLSAAVSFEITGSNLTKPPNVYVISQVSSDHMNQPSTFVVLSGLAEDIPIAEPLEEELIRFEVLFTDEGDDELPESGARHIRQIAKALTACISSKEQHVDIAVQGFASSRAFETVRYPECSTRLGDQNSCLAAHRAQLVETELLKNLDGTGISLTNVNKSQIKQKKMTAPWVVIDDAPPGYKQSKGLLNRRVDIRINEAGSCKKRVANET